MARLKPRPFKHFPEPRQTRYESDWFDALKREPLALIGMADEVHSGLLKAPGGGLSGEQLAG